MKELKGIAKLSRKINLLKNKNTALIKAIHKHKKQKTIDFHFKEFIRLKYPEIYKESVENLQSLRGKK